MARVLFASTDFPAHLDWGGLLRTARELIDRGHDVVWCTGPRTRLMVSRQGIRTVCIPVVDPGRGGPWREPPAAAADRDAVVDLWRTAFRTPLGTGPGIPDGLVRPYALLVRLIVDAWFQDEAMAESCTATLDVIDEHTPHVIVAEPTMLPAALAAEARGIPCASCGYPGALLTVHPLDVLRTTTRRIGQTVNRLRERVGLDPIATPPDPDLFFYSRALQLVYFPPEWYGRLAARRSPKALFVGSHVPDGRPTDTTAGCASTTNPLIVVAVASSYLPDPHLIHATFEAIEGVGAQGLIGGAPRFRGANGSVAMAVAWGREVLPVASIRSHSPRAEPLMLWWGTWTAGARRTVWASRSAPPTGLSYAADRERSNGARRSRCARPHPSPPRRHGLRRPPGEPARARIGASRAVWRQTGARASARFRSRDRHRPGLTRIVRQHLHAKGIASPRDICQISRVARARSGA